MRKILRTLGWVMLAVFMAGAGLLFTPWAQQHPVDLQRFVVATGVLTVFLSCAFMLSQKAHPAPPKMATDVKPAAERTVDAGNRSIAVGGDLEKSTLDASSGPRFYGTDLLKAHLDHEAKLAGKLISNPAPKVEATPKLTLYLFPGSVYVSDYRVERAPDGDGDKCWIVSVHNEHASNEGGKAPTASALSATIMFTSEASHPMIVNRSCWLGEGENEIYLKAGTTAEVLLGIPNKDEWIVYDNPNQHGVEWPSSGQWLKGKKTPLYKDVEIKGQITILSTKNNETSTLASRSFVVRRIKQNDSIFVQWTDEA